MEKNDVIEIDVIEIFLFMLRRWYVFLVSILLTVAAGWAICTFLITPQYKSTTKIIILSQQADNSLTYSDMQLASQLTKDYEELIVSRDVLESVIQDLSLADNYERLSGRVTVENITDTRIISITVEDPSAKMAQTIADCIRETAAEHIRNVTDVEAVNVAEAANLPTKPSSPSKRLWMVLSAVVGFLIVFVIEIALLLSDDSVKSSEDVEKYLGLTALAMIPKVTDNGTQDKPAKKKKRNREKKEAYKGSFELTNRSSTAQRR